MAINEIINEGKLLNPEEMTKIAGGTDAQSNVNDVKNCKCEGAGDNVNRAVYCQCSSETTPPED